MIDPAVVVTLGNFSSKLLLDTTIGITRLRGRAYSWGTRILVPTLHPRRCCAVAATPWPGCVPTSCGHGWLRAANLSL
ncbi:MAG: hypothetical protein M5U19_04120 [Microthrixaceae bacterium]|nr:hypothetical protein [Microthrixaceae bacterium]